MISDIKNDKTMLPTLKPAIQNRWSFCDTQLKKILFLFTIKYLKMSFQLMLLEHYLLARYKQRVKY